MKIVPTLNDNPTDSWVEAPLAKGRLLLANYFVTDRWQSHSYNNRVYSIVDILLEFPEEDERMLLKVRQALTELFSLHFEQVQVNTAINIQQDLRTLQIGITWIHEGRPYTITEHQENLDTLRYLTTENNTGHPLGAAP